MRCPLFRIFESRILALAFAIWSSFFLWLMNNLLFWILFIITNFLLDFPTIQNSNYKKFKIHSHSIGDPWTKPAKIKKIEKFIFLFWSGHFCRKSSFYMAIETYGGLRGLIWIDILIRSLSGYWKIPKYNLIWIYFALNEYIKLSNSLNFIFINL